MITVSDDAYTLFLQDRGLPSMADEYAQRASLNESFESDADHGEWCYVAVSRGQQSHWPFLTIVQRFSPSGYGFEPGVLLVPEEDRLFVGAGIRLLAYDLESPRRLWEDEADTGFWGWARHGEVIVMSAELELAAWDLQGNKLWSTFVEPPWHYAVRRGFVKLNVMGVKSRFDLVDGP